MLTDEEIKSLAKNAGFWGVDGWFDTATPRFREMLNHAALAEREECAKVCEEFGKTLEVDIGPNFAEEIRARTE